jgi:hypothetical protein
LKLLFMANMRVTAAAKTTSRRAGWLCLRAVIIDRAIAVRAARV